VKLQLSKVTIDARLPYEKMAAPSKRALTKVKDAIETKVSPEYIPALILMAAPFHKYNRYISLKQIRRNVLEYRSLNSNSVICLSYERYGL
jgi:hypothetical protein